MLKRLAHLGDKPRYDSTIIIDEMCIVVNLSKKSVTKRGQNDTTHSPWKEPIPAFHHDPTWGW